MDRTLGNVIAHRNFLGLHANPKLNADPIAQELPLSVPKSLGLPSPKDGKSRGPAPLVGSVLCCPQFLWQGVAYHLSLAS